MKLYFATGREMERLDELAVKNGLSILQMMELAGWHMVSLFKLLKISKRAEVSIVCGKGNKGGDGLSAARHLANYGYRVSVILISNKLTKPSQHQLNLLKKMPVKILLADIGIPEFLYDKIKPGSRPDFTETGLLEI